MLELEKSRWTLVELAREQAERFGEREFLRFEHGTVLSYAGYERDTDRLAAAFAALGVVRGDRVLALIKNRIEFMLVMLAAQKLGAIFVTINTELKGAFLAHQLGNAEPRVVVVDAELLPAFAGIAAGTGKVAAVVVTAGAVPAILPAALASARAMDFSAFAALAEGRRVELYQPAPQDIACIMYTSGTTGPAKGVLMPHAHCYLFGFGLRRTLDLTPDDVYYICMPLFHANGLLMQVLAVLLAGARAYIVERFSPSRWLDDLRLSGATVTNALGVMPEFIFRQPPGPRDREHNCRRMMAVPIGADWGPLFGPRFGIQIRQGFGMTECNIPVYGKPGDPLLPGLAGHVLDDFFELRIVDPDTDEPLPRGEVGEIVVRPKAANCFMAGYFRMPERTVEAWRNLWFHTGDAGRLDEAGRLNYVDRIKDCVRRRGENISSFEVEQVLNSYPGVAESAVVGIRIGGAGGEEEVKALIVPRPGAAIDQTALLDWCIERMPRFAVPRFVELVPELEKTPTGKLRKQALRDAGVTPATWDREAAGCELPRR
jgi:crotonobetaine/carnitine-CoA ligase